MSNAETVKSADIEAKILKALMTRRLGSEVMRKASDFYAGFVSPGDLCIDVGASVGLRTAVLSGIGASVVAVEPLRREASVLKTLFDQNPSVHFVNKALGDAVGQAEIHVSDVSGISSMSPEWRDGFAQWEFPQITKLPSSVRSRETLWSATETVEVTTLDWIVAEYGAPGFVKIDVEGYEVRVLAGLSRPVASLSFEFHTYQLDCAGECIDILSGLGECVFNYVWAETFEFALDDWITPASMSKTLSKIPNQSPWYGDVYARFAL